MTKEVQTSKLGDHYEKWKRSGVTQVEYCKRAGISYSGFKNRNYRQSLKESLSDKIEVGGKFNTVSIVEKVKVENQTAYCEIIFSGKHTVSFADQTSLIELKKLIRDLIKH